METSWGAVMVDIVAIFCATALYGADKPFWWVLLLILFLTGIYKN